MEAEGVALFHAVKALARVAGVAEFLGWPQEEVPVEQDNKSLMTVLERNFYTSSSKHLNMRIDFLTISFLHLPIEFFILHSFTHVLKIKSRPNAGEKLWEDFIFFLPLVQLVFSFVLYCQTLTWSVDVARLGPGLASFLCCELLVVLVFNCVRLLLPQRIQEYLTQHVVDEDG